MSAEQKLYPGADPVWGYLRPAMLAELLETVERSAELARDELLSMTDHVEHDGASGVLYALGEVHKVLRAVHELNDSFECSAAKSVLEADARRAQEMADDEPSVCDVAEAEASDENANDSAFRPGRGQTSDDDPVALAKSMQQKRHGGS